MADTLTTSQRHNNMSHIHSTDTSPEKAIRSALHRIGFRFRKNDRRLTGTPDIVLPHYNAVIFVNGCFWHAHGWDGSKTAGYSSNSCPGFRFPKSNMDFWAGKFTRNRDRDKRDIEKLRSDGWRVGVVWECSITGRNRRSKIADTAARISFWLEEGLAETFMEF
ncbi:MAG: DNA mismatch endonuclease Vsr [Treponema sp.]|nr:DNA mismatch endonuclease Vsr [Treponema sp.]